MGVVLRTTGLVLAGLLGALAAWMIISSDSQKDQRLGEVVGLWSLLIAAISVWGARRHEATEAGGELVVRAMTGLDRLSDAAAVRDYEQRLQAMIRREIQQTLGPELASLRSEVAALRSEFVEKVGGQLRLERIETTRLIGSDLEALQQEVQQLRVARLERLDEFTRTSESMMAAITTRHQPTVQVDDPIVDVVEAVTVTPATDHPIDALELDQPTTPAPVVEQPTAVFAPPPIIAEPTPPPPVFEEPQPSSPPWVPYGDQPAWTPPPVAEQPTVPPTVPAEPPAAAAASVADAGDPFAALPRIRPFTDFDLDPVELAPEQNYAGRRRSVDEAAEDAGRAPVDEPAATPPPPAASGGGRRRRDDDKNDLLSEILQRESQRH